MEVSGRKRVGFPIIRLLVFLLRHKAALNTQQRTFKVFRKINKGKNFIDISNDLQEKVINKIIKNGVESNE